MSNVAFPKLRRPQFFAGQLLTDQDLTALTEYIQERARLQRYRDGWGVVCGLQVTPNEKDLSQLFISAGYAVDGHGDDLLWNDPLAQPLPAVNGAVVSDCGCPEPVPSTSHHVAVPFAASEKNPIVVFDVYLVRGERKTDPTPKVKTCDKNRCEYKFVREEAKVSFVRVPCPEIDSDSTGTAAATSSAVTFLEQVKKEVAEAFTVGASVPELTWDKLTNTITAAQQAYPALNTTFPHWGTWVQANRKTELTPWAFAEKLFWMTYALRRREDCAPTVCAVEPDCHAVPLARIWAERVRGSYQIRYLDNTPPYRRWQHRDHCSTDVTLASLIGEHWSEVEKTLTKLDVVVKPEEFELLADGAHLKSLLTDEANLDLKKPLVALVVGDQPALALLRGRVVAFRKGEPASSPLVEKDAKLTVKLYKGVAGTAIPATATIAAPSTDPAVKQDTLVKDDLYRAEITLTDVVIPTGATLSVHNSNTNNILSAAPLVSDFDTSQVITAVYQAPAGFGTAKVRFTVLIDVTNNNKFVSLSGDIVAS